MDAPSRIAFMAFYDAPAVLAALARLRDAVERGSHEDETLAAFAALGRTIANGVLVGDHAVREGYECALWALVRNETIDNALTTLDELMQPRIAHTH